MSRGAPRNVAGFDPVATAGHCRYDAAAGQRAVDFVERFCQHIKGQAAGRPLLLERWQRDFVRTLFGWLRPDGVRRALERMNALWQGLPPLPGA